MQRVLVLGAGMVGRVIAGDLAGSSDLSVAIVDASPEALGDVKAAWPAIETIQSNLADPQSITSLAGSVDVVIGALPSKLGKAALSAVIESGTNYVDISFMAENALDLDEAARAQGVTAVTDCGVAPGLSNLLVGYAASQLSTVDDVRIYVGGLPTARHWPYQYKAGFAPHDVIEEYTRPARIVRQGALVEAEALSEPEHLEIDGLGTVTAFLTDGLRSLVSTINARNMVEKTIRYPGHCELMAVLRHIGLFGTEPIAVGSDRTPVRPVDLTSALLFPQWTFEPGEADLTVMRIVVSGQQADGSRRTFQWDLLDRYDPSSGIRSMSRCTAFPAAITTRLILEGSFNRPGVCAPEVMAGDPAVFDRIIMELRQRHVLLKENHRTDGEAPPPG